MINTELEKGLWSGHAAIRPGAGVFKGFAGDNKPHKHWAHQLTIGIESHISLKTPAGSIECQGVFIRAGTSHQLARSQVLSIYVDPTSEISEALAPNIGKQVNISELEHDWVEKLLSDFSASDNLTISLENFLERRTEGIQERNRKLAMVLHALQENLISGREVSRAELAKLTGLSQSRFSHWFREETGMPLRSYKKWLKLISALEIASKDLDLAQAALSSGFSDQAHFTRAVSQAFGIRPTDLLKLINHAQ